MKMSHPRFMFFDALAACAMVPIYVAIGRASPNTSASSERMVKDSTETLGFVLLVVLVFYGVSQLVRRRERQVARLPHPPKAETPTETLAADDPKRPPGGPAVRAPRPPRPPESRAGRNGPKTPSKGVQVPGTGGSWLTWNPAPLR
ncbi:MAG: hypothetical protein R3E96_11150 [Planctomycetota bacterium]